MDPFIKIFKRMKNWEWYGDTNTFRVFMHILLSANYKPSKYKGMTIGVGECVFGRKKWSEELGISEQNIRTALAHLQSTNEITIKSTNRFSVIHVEKWEFWQIYNGAPTNELTNKNADSQPTTNQQLTTSKEIEKYKNKDIVINKSPDILQGWTLEEKIEAFRKS